jgi:hypothetical protein
MFDSILNIFRKKRLAKYASDVTTGLLPLSAISTVNVVIDVEEPDFDKLKDDILAWGKQVGLKVNIYFFDFRKITKDELLLTSIQTTIIKKELDWLGMPELGKIGNLLYEQSDLFISMVDNGDFPIEFLSKCTKARFKIGRCSFAEHSYDMIISGNPTEDLISDSRKIFAAIKDFLTKIK